MHAAILRDRVADLARQVEVARRMDAGLVPLLRHVPGCIVCYVVATDDGEVASIGIFADRVAAEEGASRAAAWIEEQVGALVAGAPEVAIGAVTVH